MQSITAKQIGMLNWGSHTEGAIQLVKARGKKQLKTKIGIQLFIAVRTQMVCHVSISPLDTHELAICSDFITY